MSRKLAHSTNMCFTCLWNQLPSSLRQPHFIPSVSALSVHAPTTSSHSVNSPLSQSVTPSLFHSRLKTYLFHKPFIRHRFPSGLTTYVVLRCGLITTRMWASAQRDGCPAEYRWRPLFNAAKFGWRTTRVPCSNAAKTQNPLTLAGMPQTTEPISAVSGPK